MSGQVSRGSAGEYQADAELASIAQMFPFEYTVDSELIFGNQEFEMGNFGGSPVVVG